MHERPEKVFSQKRGGGGGKGKGAVESRGHSLFGFCFMRALKSFLVFDLTACQGESAKRGCLLFNDDGGGAVG